MSKALSAAALAALCLVAVAAVVLPAVEASAKLPIDGGGSQPAAAVAHDPGPPHYPQYDPRYEVSRTDASGTSAAAADDTGVEVIQASASALAGTGFARGVMWLYRRRHIPAS
jgi:hypothetical protein